MGKKAGERKKPEGAAVKGGEDDPACFPSEKRREKSRMAAKSRRDQENMEIFHLSQLLPLPEHIADNLDKSAVLRLSLGYIRLKAFLGCGLEKQLQYHHPYPTTTSATAAAAAPAQPEARKDSPQENAAEASEDIQAEGGASNNCLRQRSPALTTSAALLAALEGFLMIVAADGSIIYISSNIQSMLGLREVDLVGNNLLDFVHADDHDDIRAQLSHLRQEEIGGAPSPGADASSSFASDREQRQPVAACSSSELSPRAGSSTSTNAVTHSFSENSEGLLSDECSFAVRMKSFVDKRAGGNSRSPIFELVRMIGRYVPPKMNPTLAMETAMSLHSMVLLCRPVEHSQSLESQATSSLAFQSRFQLDLKYIDCDPRAEGFTGYEADDVVGRSLYDFVHPEDSLRLRNMHSKLLDGAQTMTIFLRLMLRQNQQLWVQMIASINKNPRNGKPLYITAVNYIVSHEHSKAQYHILDTVAKEGSTSATKEDSTNATSVIKATRSPAALTTSKESLNEVPPPHILSVLHDNPSVAGEIVVDTVQRMSSQPDSHRSHGNRPMKAQSTSPHSTATTAAPKRPRLNVPPSSDPHIDKLDDGWLQDRPSLLPLMPRGHQPITTRSNSLPTTSLSGECYPNNLPVNDWLQCLTGDVPLSSEPVNQQASIARTPVSQQHFVANVPSPVIASLTNHIDTNPQTMFPSICTSSTHMLSTPSFPTIVPAAPCTPPPLVTHTPTSLSTGNDTTTNGLLQQYLAMTPVFGSTDFYGSLLNS